MQALSIVAWCAACAGALWAFDATDDYVGWPIVIAAMLGLFVHATSGSMSLRRRIFLGIACAGPMITPLFVALSFGPRGLEGLDRLVLGLLFGAPVASIAAVALITRIARTEPSIAARRAVITCAVMTAVAWVLGVFSGGGIDVLIAPILGTFWLIWAAAHAAHFSIQAPMSAESSPRLAKKRK